MEWIVTGPPLGMMESLANGESSSPSPSGEGWGEGYSPWGEGWAESEYEGQVEGWGEGEGLGEGAQAMAAGGGGGPLCTGSEKAYYATRLVYAENGRTVNYLSQQQWCWYEGYTCTAGCGDCPRPESHSVVKAEEFRYDQARERYYELQLDAADFKNGNISPYWNAVPIWTDFQDGEAYSRYRVDSPNNVLALTRYEPGLWRSDSSGGTWPSAYLHNDHLGTLRYTSSGSSGAPQNPTAFTAFGEQISGATIPEFGYAGAWGYRTAAYIAGPLHVGHRYYDPASGRFLQRDPIGISDGTNVYAYLHGSPTASVDPSGLFSLDSGLVGANAVALTCLRAGNVTPWGFALAVGAGFVAGGYQTGDGARAVNALKEAAERNYERFRRRACPVRS